MKTKILIFSILLCICNFQISAQLNDTIIGDAENLGGNCFLITPEAADKAGGVWYNNPIDFSDDFTIYYQNNFGDKDFDGADGMALVFKTTPDAVIGGAGEGIGYSGINNSLIVEFDTFENGIQGDPSEDHLAIMKNGNPSHADNLAGPVLASSSSANIEDGIFHDVKVQWDATAQVLSVFFDCELRLTLTEDIKNTIFGGDSSIFFGFVGSTGGAINRQEVCFNSISFVENLVVPENEKICLGQEINIDATIPSGNSYSWSPTTGVSDAEIANPDFSPIETTDYTVTITDNCGELTDYTVTIKVNPITPTFTQVAAICNGDVLTALLTTSNNGITGTWSPALDNTATTIYTFAPDTTQPDQACAVNQTMTITVNPLITPTFTQVAAICNGDVLTALLTTSNNGITGTWSPAMDNTATTIYTFVPDSTQLGQACAVNQTMTITVNQTVIPLFDSVAAICEGESLINLPTTSKNGVLGGWSPAMNNMETTNYTFTPDASEICAEITTLEIVVNEIININLDLSIVVNKLDYNQSVEVYVANAFGFYEYKLDGGLWQDSNLFENLIVGKYSIAVRKKSGCSNESTILFLLIDYPRFFTPNGDGINDTWNLEGLESQPEAVITIFDRYGKILSIFRADELGWNGIWNGKRMPSNTYWFKVSYFEIEDRPKTVRSNFSLLRK